MEPLTDSSPIPCNKYPTFGQLKAQSQRTHLVTVAKMKPCPERDFLDEWVYDTYYSKKRVTGNLTMRIQVYDNLICYRKIVKDCLNGKDILKTGTTLSVFTEEECKYFLELQDINPSVFGTFMDYLVRRMIAEIAKIPFKDCRSNWIPNDHVCDAYVDYMKKSRKELLDLCKQHNLKNYHKLNCQEINDLLNASIKTCVYNSVGRNASCNFPLCQTMCLKKVRDIANIPTESIVKEIFITSLLHSECFGFAPRQESFDAIWKHLEDSEKVKQHLIMPLERVCKLLAGSSSDILLNPAFGGTLDIVKTGIPSDADLVIQDTLIDIKCTKQKNEISEFLQLFGYSAMSLLNPRYHRKINKIQILNILHGTLLTYQIDTLTTDNCVAYIRMLTKDELHDGSDSDGDLIDIV
jgi:hypothetical protein